MSHYQTDRTRRRLLAVTVTIVVHLLLLGLLYLIHLRSSAPPLPKMEELVLVSLGNAPLSTGAEEPEGKPIEEASQSKPTQAEPVPAMPKPQPAPQPKPLPSQSQPKPAQQPKLKAEQTQRLEQTIAAQEAEVKRKAEQEQRNQALRAKLQADAEAKTKAEAARKAQQAKEAAEAKVKAEAEQAAKEAERRKQIGQSVAGAFGGKSSGSTSQGTTSTESGNQGSSQGASDSYSLTGRSIVSNGGVPTRPKTSRAITGTVVVTIVVNASGRVTEAQVNPQGTNIADPTIRSAALVAAKATHFNAIPNASEQRGSIKYRFVQ